MQDTNSTWLDILRNIVRGIIWHWRHQMFFTAIYNIIYYDVLTVFLNFFQIFRIVEFILPVKPKKQ